MSKIITHCPKGHKTLRGGYCPTCKDSPNQGKRGKDHPDTIRPISASKTIATRYYERTGRRIEQELEQQRDLINTMLLEVCEIEDTQERFAALAKAQDALAKFNNMVLPYMETKMGTLQTEQTVEEARSADAAIAAALEHDDEDNPS